MERVAARRADAAADGVGALVAGRYELLEQLARGGVGRVYRARDRSTGRDVALKRLLRGHETRGPILALFEREYRTLHSLKHPRIIEVYDYGIDAGGAYYTMELLSGTDLGKLAPLPYQQACAYLRDVASSLALLHARRLLHRDVSPHNVRVTEGGRCKLIDFGALTGFGVASHIVGTPPCIPPEALRGAPLDQRADLYALGATAYYLLTRRHAYYATSIAALTEAWQHAAPPPSHYATGIPKGLDDLVSSLIHHDPLVRPASAAEVIDRLNAVGQLAGEDEPLAAASYFWSTGLVARDQELEQLQRALREAIAGRGGALVLRGATGVGRSRLLSEACVQAQLAGATVLHVDSDRYRHANGVALALATTLFDVAPDAALAAATPHAAVLGRLLPSLDARLPPGERAVIPETPGEWRGRVQAALAAWFAAVATEHPLVIAVDNLESADDSSAALLAALSVDAPIRKLLVLSALRNEHDARQGSLRYLLEAARPIELAPLDGEQCVALTRAMFGDVPNVIRLGEWLHRTSDGVASHCFELATELRRRGIVRYAAGTWVVPHDAGTEALPVGLREALSERLQRLSPGALGLARALSVNGAPLDAGLCRATAEAAGVADVFARLDELTENDVLALAGDRYRFRHAALRELLLAPLADAQRGSLHRAMARALLATAEPDDRMARVDAGWQLVRGGEELPGAQLLERTAREFEIGTGSLQAAIPALEEARKVYRKHGRSLYELLPIVARLATEGYYSDRRLSLLYAEEAFALLRQATGLGIADKLRPLLGRKLSVYLGLAAAALRFYLTPRSRRMASFGEIFFLLVNCVTTQAGAGTVCLDTEAIARAAAFIEPLTVLGERHITSAIHEYCVSLTLMSLERQSEVRARWHALLARLSDPTQLTSLPDYVRQLYRGGALFALGIVETWVDGDEALARAQELEGLGLRIYDRAAQQIRMLHHAGRGELELAEQYRKRMELHAVQTGSAWQVEVTLPLTLGVVYSALNDVVSLKRVTGQVEQLAERYHVGALRRIRDVTKAVYLLMCGDAEAALAIHHRVLSENAPRAFTGWARVVGHQADAYNQLGRHDEALRVCEDALRHVQPEDHRFVRMFLILDVQHALALAGLGRSEDAARKLQLMIAAHEDGRGPLTMGLLHEARARVALIAKDRNSFSAHLAAAERWLRPTRASALIARCEALARQAESVFDFARPLSSAPGVHHSSVVTVRSALSDCTDRRARANRSLELLLTESGASEGHLFLLTGDHVELGASSSTHPPSSALQREASELCERFRLEAEATKVESNGAAATVEQGRPRLDGFRTHLLWCVDHGAPAVAGVVAVRGGGENKPYAFHFLQAIAEALRSDDVQSSADSGSA